MQALDIDKLANKNHLATVLVEHLEPLRAAVAEEGGEGSMLMGVSVLRPRASRQILKQTLPRLPFAFLLWMTQQGHFRHQQFRTGACTVVLC